MTNTADSPHDGAASDEELLVSLAGALCRVARPAVARWIVEVVSARASDLARQQRALVEREAEAAAFEIGGRLEALLMLDIDQQRSNPLLILRSAVPVATRLLDGFGVAQAQRDAEAQRLHPDDRYDLTPGGFVDFGDDVHEAGIRWGAGKAHLHRRRHLSAEAT